MDGSVKTICLCSAGEMNLEKTFGCGQCFRWNRQEDGSYLGMAGGIPAVIWQKGEQIFLQYPAGADEKFWRDYFDLDTDYASLSAGFGVSEYMKEAAEYGRGIRILRQDPWEALCSFIFSQCNNIPRIRKIVENLCLLFGEEVSFGGVILHSFPSAEKTASLLPENLIPLKAGYRVPYVLNAAKMVCSGELDLQAMKACSSEEAMEQLMRVPGVGRKVASCAVLFGLGHMDAFPVDVWMKRALKEHFPANFDPRSFGAYAGLAQQYIFYYARSQGK